MVPLSIIDSIPEGNNVTLAGKNHLGAWSMILIGRNFDKNKKPYKLVHVKNESNLSSVLCSSSRAPPLRPVVIHVDLSNHCRTQASKHYLLLSYLSGLPPVRFLFIFPLSSSRTAPKYHAYLSKSIYWGRGHRGSQCFERSSSIF